jgi:hypothetical protein
MRCAPLVLAVLLGACGGDREERTPPAEETLRPDSWKATHRLAAPTESYRESPAQARPPDATLPAGTRVLLLQEQGSYSEVELENRMRVWVATDALAPL